MVAYVYAADHKSERAEAHLGYFAVILQVDSYSGDVALIKNCKITGINPHAWMTRSPSSPTVIPPTASAKSCPGSPWLENIAYEKFSKF
jgi:hypothetical protein